MIGAIAGDIIGSVHEGAGTKTKDFPLFDEECRFTDDTVLTVAVAEKPLRGGDYADLFHDYFHAYPDAGYGETFFRWAGTRRREPYNSWGNGSAMRVSPVGFACTTLDEVMAEAKASAHVTNNHPEGVRGAQATAVAIYLARIGWDKPKIKAHIETAFAYDLSARLDDIRNDYEFDVSCQGSGNAISLEESRDYPCRHSENAQPRIPDPRYSKPSRLECSGECPSPSFHPIRRDVRDQPLVEGDLLDFPGSMANVHHEPVDLKHPRHRVGVQFARQGPVRIKLVHFEHLADCRQLRRPATWAGSEIVVDVGGPHIRRLAFVVQEVHAAHGSHDAAGPGISFGSRRWRDMIRHRILESPQLLDRPF